MFAVCFHMQMKAADVRLTQAYDAMYNLDFSAAHRSLAQYKAAHPSDPFGPASDAAAWLFSEFQRLHVLESEFFLDDARIVDKQRLVPDSNARARFNDDLNEAERLAQRQMQQPAERSNAMFADTLRMGLQADYLALIDKRDMAALAEMKKARELAEQLVSDSPKYYDAYIAVGVENYLLSLKPAPMRWILHATGAQTDKQTGLDKLRLTADHGEYMAPYARLLLAIAALRDGNRQRAHDLLAWLSLHYPKNTLYAKELAKLR